MEKTVENELLLSFGSGESSLIRATVFLRDDRCAIMLASHHAALDGRSHLYILRDLLTVLAGEQLPTEEPIMQPRTSTLYGRSLSPYQRLADIKPDDAACPMIHAIPPIHIARHLFLSEDVKALVTACKREEVSVHCALLVALAIAGACQNSIWHAGEIRCLTPVDIRSRFQLGDAVGMLVTLHSIALNGSESFWAEARRVNRSLKAEALHSSSPAFLDVADHLVSDEHSPNSHVEVLEGSNFAHDLMLTNYGIPDISMRIGPFHIHDLFTAGIAGGLDTQKVAAITFDGSLHLTHVSQRSMPDLLPQATKVLLEAAGTSHRSWVASRKLPTMAEDRGQPHSLDSEKQV